MWNPWDRNLGEQGWLRLWWIGLGVFQILGQLWCHLSACAEEILHGPLLLTLQFYVGVSICPPGLRLLMSSAVPGTFLTPNNHSWNK